MVAENVNKGENFPIYMESAGGQIWLYLEESVGDNKRQGGYKQC